MSSFFFLNVHLCVFTFPCIFIFSLFFLSLSLSCVSVRYESCWSAIVDKLDGVIVCFDPLDKSQANDVRIWAEWFVKRANLLQGQAAIFCHGELAAQHKPLNVRASLSSEHTIPVPIINVSTNTAAAATQNIDAEGNLPETIAHKQFNLFIHNVIQNMKNQN